MNALPDTNKAVIPPALNTSRPSTLKAQNVSFSYGDKKLAVDDASFTLPVGKLTAIVGPNGCGKTTLLHLLMGQLAPASGSITVIQPGTLEQLPHTPVSVAAPRPINSIPPASRARLLALVPQNPTFSFRYTVRQVVLMGRWHLHAQPNKRLSIANMMGFETQEDHNVANEAMWMSDIHHLADRPIDQLSGGERQRVVIARALAQQTPIILLDEPVTGLDLAHELDLLYTLKELSKQQQRTICIITHDLNMALEQADYAMIMNGGKIAAEGKPRRILTPENLEPIYGVNVTNHMGRLIFTRKNDRV